MAGVRIFNICCQAGCSDNTIVEDTWQMTDISVLKSIFRGKAGRHISMAQVPEETTPSDNRIVVRRTTMAYLIRELIWKLGHWYEQEFRNFIVNINPDILYLPIYRSGYICDIQKKAYQITKCPIVCHISDDVYSMPPSSQVSPLKRIYYKWIRKKIKYLISKSEYCEVFAKNMAEEYHTIFKKPFHLIGKGISPQDIRKNDKWKKQRTLKFVYTGNYGGERGAQLLNLAMCLERNFKPTEAELRIFSATIPDAGINNRLIDTKRVRLMGALKPEQIPDVQQGADYLIHVEGFSAKSIIETRMSFSTKLIDYMLAQRPIIAIGPMEINSIKVLKDENAALIANSTDDLDDIISKIAKGDIDTEKYIENARQYLLTKRDRRIIQNGIHKRLISIIR